MSNSEELQSIHYNATVLSMARCHEDLMILRVRPDAGVPRFHAGQYTVLGLGYWEPRVSGCQAEELAPHLATKLIKRAYSVSCPLLDSNDRLVGVEDVDFLEFYISLVRFAAHPPALTPRLFQLKPGDRIYCDSHFHGHYTLHSIPADSTLIFAATGTGEAPHNAMAAQWLKANFAGNIVNVTCVRLKEDLGYWDIHRKLEKNYPNYHYVALTTREPENMEESHPQFVGKRYLQQYFESGDLEAETGVRLNPESTHVFLCGNPEMIGVPLRTHDPQKRYPKPKGMVEVLESLGFHIDQPHHPGNIHFEKYW